jgi:flagellar biogenesis protein FliO
MGAARVLGYDHKQRDWIKAIQDAKDAEEARVARQELGKSALKVLGVLVIIGAIIGLIIAAIYGLSQVPWGDLLPKSTPASTTSSSSSTSPFSSRAMQLFMVVSLLIVLFGMFHAVKAQNIRLIIPLIVVLSLLGAVFYAMNNLPAPPSKSSNSISSVGAIE